MRSRALTVIALVIVAVCEMTVGWFRFMSWTPWMVDDEGYMVVAFREWAARGGLYDEVYSQYGPFNTLVFGLPLRILGIELDFTQARYLTLAMVVGTTLLLAIAVVAITGKVITAMAAQLVAFFVMIVVAEAPLHPTALLLLLVAATVANVAALRPRQPVVSDVLTGALLAAILLTKVNVGAFLIVAVAYWTASVGAKPDVRRWLLPLSELAFIALGPALLVVGWSRLDEGDLRLSVFGALRFSNDLNVLLYWAAAYAAAAIIVVAFARRWNRVDRWPGAPVVIGHVVLGFLGMSTIVVGLILVTGTSVRALIENVAIRPSRQSEVLLILAPMSRSVLIWAVLTPLVLVVGWWLSRRPNNTAVAVSAVARLVGGVVLLLAAEPTLTTFLGSKLPAGAFSYLPLVGLVVLPRAAPGSASRGPARLFLAATAVTQTLQAFPVAGIQWSAGLLLPAVCGVVVIDDGVRELQAALVPLSRTPAARWRGAFGVLPALLVLAIGWVHQAELRRWVTDYQSGFEMTQGGSTGIRTPFVLAGFARYHDAPVKLAECTQIYSFPGINSIYVWSDRQPPTGFNTGLWSELLNSGEKQATVDALEATDDPVCLLVDRTKLRADGRLNIKRGPLEDYFQNNFALADESQFYVIWTRRTESD